MKTLENGKLLMALIVLLPILSVYGFSKIGIDFGSLLLTAAFICILIFKARRNKILIYDKKFALWYIYILYALVVTVMNCELGDLIVSEKKSIFLHTLKWFIYIIICLISVLNEYINYEWMVSFYLKVCKIVTILIFIQALVYYMFHIISVGYVNHYLMVPEYYYNNLQQYYISGSFIRLSSVFYEPAHYFEYVFMGLIICLFKRENIHNNYFWSILLSLGIVISSSGMGIAFLVIIWTIYYFYLIKNNSVSNRNYILIYVLPLFACSFIIFLIFSTQGRHILYRIFNLHAQGGNAIIARTGTISYVFKRSFFNMFFGNGYFNIDNQFYSSWTFNILCLGILGTLIILLLYVTTYTHAKYIEIKIIILINFVFCLFSTLFMGKYIVFYFSFILCGCYIDKDIKNNNVIFKLNRY